MRRTIASGLATLLMPAAAFAQGPLEADAFDVYRDRHGDLDAKAVLEKIPAPRWVDRLGFDPMKAEYFDRITKELKLTKEELALYEKSGVVSVDHAQRYSFGAAYYAIYARDLPVLVTTDSVLHALHKSYDDILMQLETQYLAPTLAEVLGAAHEQTKKSDADVDLYLTVALNLLAGATDTLATKSRLGQDEAVLGILRKVKKLKLEVPGTEETLIYGGRRFVDWSQFRPRGHYTKSEELKRYFAAMMWLGRADTGFEIAESERQLEAAMRLVALVRETKGLPKLRAMSDVVDFMVGQTDNLTAFDMDEATKDGAAPKAVAARLAKLAGAKQKIRSQVVVSNPNDTIEVEPPSIFQLFGQRFVIDSFVLSKVVFDSILYEEKKVMRMMPTGLDVMAALGNDEAVRLLAPELERRPYGANLLAARDYVNDHGAPFWKENVYHSWLGALRTLDDAPANTRHFPRAMQTRAWAHKQLQTQLGSWAELRHDTILYAKQSYTAYPSCEYPTGFVEPYPAFYLAVKAVADTATQRIRAADYGAAAPLKARHIAYFENLAQTMLRLEILATKELAARPFTDDEEAWLRKTIDIRGGGSGPPRYDGWFPQLFYGGGTSASEWDPTVADVHTDTESGTVLEVAVGDVGFVVVAVDNEDDVTAFVGPVFSYFEFAHPAQDRLTNEKWQQMIREGKTPARPEWTQSFQGPRVPRHAGR